MTPYIITTLCLSQAWLMVYYIADEPKALLHAVLWFIALAIVSYASTHLLR